MNINNFSRRSNIIHLLKSQTTTKNPTTTQTTHFQILSDQTSTIQSKGCNGLRPFWSKSRECSSEASPLLSSSFSSSTTSFSKTGFVGWYLGMVKSRPVVTKSVTSSLIYVAADLSSQTMSQPTSDYELVRTLRMGGYGLIVLGPSLHFWFNLMSKLFPKQDLASTFKKMAMGQALYGPFMTVVFFSLNARLQGENTGEIIARLKRDLLPTLKNGVMYWPICDFITFKFVPVHLQPLVSNSFSYLWTVYMTYMASLERVGATS